MNELEDFINPSPYKNDLHGSLVSQHSSQKTNFLQKLKHIETMPDSINDDIEEIGEYCCKLIGDLNR